MTENSTINALVRRAQFRVIQGKKLVRIAGKMAVALDILCKLSTGVSAQGSDIPDLSKTTQASTSDKLCRRRRKTPVDPGAVSARSKPPMSWPPIKTYALPEILPASDNLVQTFERLAHENKILRQVIERMRSEIQWQIEFWETGLKNGEWESVTAVKRRISRLKGALEYKKEWL
jgi:hypothetical protein